MAFSAYSLRVKNELDSLEQKLGQLVRLSQRLRSENQQLRQALAEVESQNRQCNDKVNAAKSRLQQLLTNLPEDA
jgi:cell division protein ZapB